MSEEIKKEWFNLKITLWQRLKLLFIKPKITFDFGKNDESIATKWKILDGKIYFLECKTYDK